MVIPGSSPDFTKDHIFALADNDEISLQNNARDKSVPICCLPVHLVHWIKT